MDIYRRLKIYNEDKEIIPYSANKYREYRYMIERYVKLNIYKENIDTWKGM